MYLTNVVLFKSIKFNNMKNLKVMLARIAVKGETGFIRSNMQYKNNLMYLHRKLYLHNLKYSITVDSSDTILSKENNHVTRLACKDWYIKVCKFSTWYILFM